MNKEDTVALVLAHGGVEEAVDRHFTHWSNFSDGVIFTCPDDRPLDRTFPQVLYGKNGRYATDCNARMYYALREAARLETDGVIIYEWDSLMFRQSKTDICERIDPWVSAAKFDNKDPKFVGPYYLHFPVALNKAAVKVILKAMRTIGTEAEYGFGDRYIGLAAHTAGVSIDDAIVNGTSFTRNHITMDDVPLAVDAIKAGAIMHHGIKDVNVFRALEKEHLRQLQ